MENEFLYRQAYFENLHRFAEKSLSESFKTDNKFNFGKDFEFDFNSGLDNTKAKYKLQGGNPMRILRNLEKELTRLNLKTKDGEPTLNYTAEDTRTGIQETTKFEIIAWKLFTECVSADHIYFENLKADTLSEEDRNPMSLLADIIKGDHEIISCHYILKWLEKIYSREIKMPEQLLFKDLDKFELLEDDNFSLKEEHAQFLFCNLRSGKLGQIKDRVPSLICAWKTSMLQGDMPSLGELIDPIGCFEGDFKNPLLEKDNKNYKRDCNFSSGDYFNHIKICKIKCEGYGKDKVQNKFEKALYGSFCGDTTSMLKVSYDWDDILWCYLKTVLFYNVTEKYIQVEDEYLEYYNMTHGDYHCSDEQFKIEFQNWPFPETCPIDFDAILEKTIKEMPRSSLCFSNRETNPFIEVLILLLQIQLKPSRIYSQIENRWNILVDKIADLNSIQNYSQEDLIFLRFSAHLLIMLYILQRIDFTRVEQYNEVLFKFINSEQEIDSQMHTFYLNFIIGDGKKVEYYSEQVYSITDAVVQEKILENIDLHLPELKEDFKDTIKAKIVGGIKPKSNSKINIHDVVKKLNWLFYQDNYLEFYKTVLEIARKYFLNGSSEFGYHHYIETLYDELRANLDFCETQEESLKQHGVYAPLINERKKHCLLVQLIHENELPEIDSYKPSSVCLRKIRIVKTIDKVLRDCSKKTLLFDYPLEAEYDQKIKFIHQSLKTKLIPSLVLLKLDLLFKAGYYVDCLKIMEFIMDKTPEDDMKLEPVLGEPSDPYPPGCLSLKPYLNQHILTKIDAKLADAMLRSPEVIEYLLSK
ncbi:unnamed protein product [Moneuplotes crassus]|uniref:Nuclear pore complex protein n=1 Tax=Euplotes crassus TaxID=5936 RepID=A0AAD2DBA4_EUPCR|nr:unnamed protein product [Moneuplotes crassus]